MTSSLPQVASETDVPEGHGLFEEAGRNGDTKHTWDPKNADQVAAARALFDTLKSKGHAIFRIKRFGGAGEKMNDFDPEAGRILAVPPLAGG